MSTELNREFTTDELRMAKRHLRSCSTSLTIREMQMKTTLRYHLTPVRIARINNTDDNLCWRGCGVRGMLFHCWWGCKHVQPLSKSVWQILKQLGVTQPQEPVIPLLGTYTLGYIPRDVLSYQKSISSTMIIAALSVIAIAWKQPRSFMRRMVNESVDQINIEVLPSGKKAVS